MLLFVTLFQAILAYNCADRTSLYKEHGSSNSANYYFDLNTYGTEDRCTKQTAATFRTLMNNPQTGRSCNGLHCNPATSDNSWSCQFNGRTTEYCYQVEHIIPTVNNMPELIGCSTDISGNLVMAFGKWNRELSNQFIGEKVEIYGDIYTHAYTAVYECCHGTTLDHEPVCVISSVTWCVLGIFGAIVIIVIAAYIAYSYNRAMNSNIQHVPIVNDTPIMLDFDIDSDGKASEEELNNLHEIDLTRD